VNGFLQQLFQVGLYKRTQGRVTRQVTFFSMVVGIALGCARLSSTMVSQGPAWSLAIPTLLGLAGSWVSYRLVNIPKFADFLIAVEAEMNKVSWPTRGELFRSSLVVLVTIFALALVLYFFDFFWGAFFQFTGILSSG
jgi:preprotein translocase subunit SecE